MIIEEMKPETFSSVLDFIYTASVELNPSNAVYIHFAGNYLFPSFFLSRFSHVVAFILFVVCFAFFSSSFVLF